MEREDDEQSDISVFVPRPSNTISKPNRLTPSRSSPLIGRPRDTIDSSKSSKFGFKSAKQRLQFTRQMTVQSDSGDFIDQVPLKIPTTGRRTSDAPSFLGQISNFSRKSTQSSLFGRLKRLTTRRKNLNSTTSREDHELDEIIKDSLEIQNQKPRFDKQRVIVPVAFMALIAVMFIWTLVTITLFSHKFVDCIGYDNHVMCEGFELKNFTACRLGFNGYVAYGVNSTLYFQGSKPKFEISVGESDECILTNGTQFRLKNFQ